MWAQPTSGCGHNQHLDVGKPTSGCGAQPTSGCGRNQQCDLPGDASLSPVGLVAAAVAGSNSSAMALVIAAAATSVPGIAAGIAPSAALLRVFIIVLP